MAEVVKIILFGMLAWFFALKVAIPLALKFYFKSDDFIAMKNSLALNAEKCNALNDHIEDLKLSYSGMESFDYGEGQLVDNSRYNMQRRQWANQTNNRRTHQCSAAVVKNANNQPFKYLCKYFNIKTNEATLEQLEMVLNNFLAVEQGRVLLINERDTVVNTVIDSIPWAVWRYDKERVKQELGFTPVNLNQLHFPEYTFQYISAGGNSSSSFIFKLNLDQLERFVGYLSEIVKFKKSAAGQRSLMTARLREQIKQRDNYTCKMCYISTSSERNLLLEIDHIIPISKGGMTTEDNLQVLCWRCNRSKGSKVA